jgi:dihydroxyacetone kinase-like protein
VTGDELRALLTPALERWEASRDELRRLDAALGDGDLGITVAKGAGAMRDALAALPEQATPSQVLRAAASSLASANPSTFSALVAGGLLAGAAAAGDAARLDRALTLAIGRAGAERMAARGKAQLGDKTVLDALVPSLDALESARGSGRDALGAMIAAARRGLDETTPLRSQRGRAAWVQERSEGERDPGATAYLRFLEALGETWNDEREDSA